MDTTMVTTPFGKYRCFEDQFADDLRRYGAHQRSDLAVMIDLVRPGDVVVDVGAFVGTVTVPLASAVGPTGHVFSFEPVTDHYRLLIENVEQNGVAAQVTPVNALVGTSSGRGGFTASAWSMSTATTAFRPTEEGSTDTGLASWRLDDWLVENAPDRPTVRLLKVDVEGMELAVLEGAVDVLARDRPFIELEVGGGRGASIKGTARFLRDQGYRILLNVAPRDSDSDAYRLGPLARLTLIGDMLSDVLAIPNERPVPLELAASWLEVQWVVLSGRYRLRTRWRRLRSKVRRG